MKSPRQQRRERRDDADFVVDAGDDSVASASGRPLFWVAMGASAGGLEALRGLVRNLPTDLDATYIVVQHMAPQHRSLLAQIIGRETSMPVLDVIDNVEPEANFVYITPPNSNIVVDEGRLRLVEPSQEPAASKPSIDVFFESLSVAKCEHAIGIILSGTGADGSNGIEAVRKRGGITIAQDEMTARYASMPVAALETGCIDLVMSPEEIGTEFRQITQLPRDLVSLKASPPDMESIAELVQLLLDLTRVNFRQYKTATVQRRIERRMAAVKVETLEEYVAISKGSPQEVEALFRDLLISVTSFFRDPDEFEALRTYVRQIVQEKPDGPIRVWVPGTATGEEAYTIAMLFADEMGGARSFANSGIQIFATDVDSHAIEIARRAFYAETALAAVPERIVEQYFDVAPEGYTVTKALRDKIVFSVHDVVQDPPYLNLDLVSCRNLMIYFQASLQAQVFSRFHYALVEYGVLFLGKAEAVVAAGTLFRAANGDKHIFFPRPAEGRRLLSKYDPVEPQPRRGRASKPVSAEARDLAKLRTQFDSLVDSIGPNAILVNNRLRVVRAYGDLERYVSLSSGSVDTSLASLLRRSYMQEVRAAVPAAIRRQSASLGVVRTDEHDPGRREQINVYPVAGGERDEAKALVVFRDWTVEVPDPEPSQSADANEEVSRLREELAIAHANIQQLIEDADKASEENQTLNEELNASNEELQSTNEEMETANEELQSTNEELSAVNDELHVNAQQLNTVNQSLRNILESVAIPMLVVDRGLNITNASRASEEVFGIDLSTKLPHVSRCQLPSGFPNLVELLDQAMDSETRVDRIVDDAMISATLTVVPNLSTAGEVVGGIVLLTDNSQELRRTRNELRLVIDNLPASILVRNLDGTILQANHEVSSLVGRPIAEIEGEQLSDLFDEDTTARIGELDRAAVESKGPVLAEDIQIIGVDGVARTFSSSQVPILDERTDTTIIYSLAIDVTSQRRATEALQVSERRLDRAVNASNLGHWEVDVVTDELYVSSQFRQIVGLGPSDVFDSFAEVKALLHPDDVGLFAESKKWRVDPTKDAEVELRLRHTDGSYRWVALGEVEFEVEQPSALLVGTMRDITVRKLAEIELHELNNQLALASKLATVGYWRVELANSTLFCSDEVFRIAGVSFDGVQPSLMEALKFYHPDDRERVRNGIDSALASGLPFEMEARMVRPDGSVRVVRSKSAVGKEVNGSIVSIFGVMQDITKERQREDELEELLVELSRSNEELSRFSYVCSHDMKEPVRLIESMAEMLLDPVVSHDEEQRSELLARISSNMSRLRSTIDGLLAYSRLEAKVEASEIDLNELVAQVVETSSLAIEEANASVTVGKLPYVSGARVHFVQLFQNLIGNAIKYNDKESPQIEISFEDRGTEHVVRVDDNGPGIPTSSRATAFELFGRLHLRDGIDGTGLGLSICRRIAQQYGGSIECTEGPLGGASFAVSLPVSGHPDA